MALCDYRVGIGASSEMWRRWAEAPSPLRGGLDVSRAESDCWRPIGPSRLVDVAGDPRRRVDVPAVAVPGAFPGVLPVGSVPRPQPQPSSALERALWHMNIQLGDVFINRAMPLAHCLLAQPLAERAAIARELLGAGEAV